MVCISGVCTSPRSCRDQVCDARGPGVPGDRILHWTRRMRHAAETWEREAAQGDQVEIMLIIPTRILNQCFRSRGCGFSGSQPLVCCPDTSLPVQRGTGLENGKDMNNAHESVQISGVNERGGFNAFWSPELGPK